MTKEEKQYFKEAIARGELPSGILLHNTGDLQEYKAIRQINMGR